MMRSVQLLSLLAVIASLSIVGGCGSAPSDSRKFGEISGRVTVKGTPLAGGMQVVFLPASGEKGAFADIGADGTYKTEAVAGANQVYLVPTVGGDGAYVDPAKLGVLPQYLDARDSGLTAEVIEGDKKMADFEVGQ
ncbi:MAG: hypothetical protein KDA84_02480 [Planctomycetaceae bacterium]|nr:hypothetical protein [Planctomycetaceae bacterium]